MLIKFKVENFRSFGQEVEFSCLATAEKGHRQRVFSGPQEGLRVLTVGAIYGANASGKSNLYRAVRAARRLVVAGVKFEAPVPVEPFRLDAGRRSSPTRFYFEVLVGDKVLGYQFAVNKDAVVEESLTELRPASERLVFARVLAGEAEPKWDLGFFRSQGLKAEDMQFIDFVAKGTPKNQLFLREAHARNVKHFEPLWRWFRNSLVLIDPQTTSEGLEYQLQEQPLREFSTRMLRSADLGIDRLDTQMISLESVDLPSGFKEHLNNECKEGQQLLVRNTVGLRLNLRRENGKLRVTKLVAYHRGLDPKEAVAFDIGEESDGTQRVVDLLPAFHDLASRTGELVVFVDEIDRSLHSRLTRGLIEGYLSCRPANARSQLLFTTHDATLLDQALFRRDEVWFIEKNEEGESQLSSLGDFKLRSDTRLMKDYLLGRFGGVPRVQRLPLRPSASVVTSANPPGDDR